jgi:hypothetical protein
MLSRRARMVERGEWDIDLSPSTEARFAESIGDSRHDNGVAEWVSETSAQKAPTEEQEESS